MTQRTTLWTLWTLIALLALATACPPGEEPQGSQADAGVPGPRPAAELPEAAVLIAHRVADFNFWKETFDEHAPAREEASCLGHSLKRGVDDPEMVYVYCLATDLDRLREFLDGTDLAEAMTRAGVVGEPEIRVIKPMSRDLVAGRLLPGIIVLHAVEDYDTWRVAYDDFEDFRRQSGIVGHAVSRELDDPNRVVVYHQAENVDDLRAFVESTELAEAMQRAGVVGEPDIRFIRVVDFADY